MPSSMSHRPFLSWLLIGHLALLLGACGGIPRSERPAQVEERGGMPQSEQGDVPQIAAYTPPARPAYVRPAPKRAVGVLMQRAQDQQRGGDLDGATISLERALRIAPDDALLWHRLAGVKLDQRGYALVTQLAAKSNALASRGDVDLRRANWTLIAQARRALGDLTGARLAERRAAELR